MTTRPWPSLNTIRFAIEGVTAKGVPWANIFWVQTSPPALPTPTQLAALCTSFYNAFATHLWVLQGKDASMTRCVGNYYGTPTNQVVADYLHTTAGGSSNNTEVDSLSAAISWHITQTWRGGKPRTYMAAMPTEAFADSNTLDSGYITDLEAGAAAFLTAVAAITGTPVTGMSLVCQSFFTGNAPRSAGISLAITGGVVHPRIDSMRRRLGREVS